jgi:hypothetical protein
MVYTKGHIRIKWVKRSQGRIEIESVKLAAWWNFVEVLEQALQFFVGRKGLHIFARGNVTIFVQCNQYSAGIFISDTWNQFVTFGPKTVLGPGGYIMSIETRPTSYIWKPLPRAADSTILEASVEVNLAETLSG